MAAKGQKSTFWLMSSFFWGGYSLSSKFVLTRYKVCANFGEFFENMTGVYVLVKGAERKMNCKYSAVGLKMRKD